ncbi:HAD family hydrolase [Sphingobacterium thalpophilum]|uniref:HAD family phosphatase n=1 Tax=Sphingobacterium thalpophilum TaxID=259 RepID=A0A4U9VH13_9SPHI|nr:HAD family phosphatase [Sphingobacterium thalpophilum]VTR45357.1 Phosphatase YqaB [Sphingobacterium thalpophilum]
MTEYAAIFDMDGVISHTNPFHAEAFRAFFKNHNIEQATEEEFEQHMYGKHNSYIMQHFFKRPISPEELRTLEFEKEQLFRVIYKDHVAPIKGLIEFLGQLKDSGFKLAVATSAPKENMDLILDELNIRSLFSSTLSSEDVKLHKPHPEVYLKSAENLGIPIKQCIVFEDSFSGITAAQNAGMKVVAVLSTHKRDELPPSDIYIQNYTEITVANVKSILR